MSDCRLTRPKAAKSLEKFHHDFPMTEGCFFVLATVDDLDDILDIANETFKTDQPTRPGIRHFLTKAHALIFMLKDKNGDSIGYLHIEGNARNKSVYMNTAILRPAWRRKGLGNAMFVLQDRVAQDAGFHTIRCHISESTLNNLHLAKKNGYKEVWFGPYLDEGSNSYLLRKRFKNN